MELAQADPVAIADALERLLTDHEHRARRSRLALEFVRRASWDAAGRQVEAGLCQALSEREETLREHLRASGS
jgi:glycosyltransferase involved in cell wall biosynthesis